MTLTTTGYYMNTYKEYAQSFRQNLVDMDNIDLYKIKLQTANQISIELFCTRQVYESKLIPLMKNHTKKHVVISYMESYEHTESRKEGQFYHYTLVCRMWNYDLDVE